MAWTFRMLEGKVALITGASRGIGRAISECFAKEGATLLLNGRNEESLQSFANELQERFGGRVETVAFDVSDYEAIKRGYRKIFSLSKQLDILVNNAGVLDDALIGMVTHEQIEKTFGINTFGTLYMAQYASRMMQKRKQGSIINISSIVGVYGNEGQAVYSGSKSAVIGITRSLAKELAPSQIRVNAIAPGFIDTDMTLSLPKEKYQERMNSIKMGRIGKPEDVANTALFLASDLSEYVTGQVIGVDGGMLI
jgi:3-oxoacyl-[acyl-carrier protein] reductase